MITKEIELLLSTGLVPITKLAEYLDIPAYRLSFYLRRRHVPIIYCESKLLKSRMVRLEDLARNFL